MQWLICFHQFYGCGLITEILPREHTCLGDGNLVLRQDSMERFVEVGQVPGPVVRNK